MESSGLLVQTTTEKENDIPQLVPSKRKTVLVFLAYLLLTVVMTWPVTAQLTTHVAGGRDDLWIHQWNLWWAKEALLTGKNIFYTPYLYYPHGVSLLSHNLPWFNIALWLPLQAVVGGVAAYNLIFMAVFALNGFSMYLLARELTQSQAASFVGGLVYGFWPYTMSHFDHTNMMVVFTVPLVLLYLHRTLQEEKVSDALLMAVFLALTGIIRWQLLIMSGIILGVYGLYLLLSRWTTLTRRTVGLLALTGGLAALLMAPLLVPLLVDQFTRDYPEDIFLDEPEWGRTDLLAYVTPSVHNGLWRQEVMPLYDNFTVNRSYIAFLGYTTILVALWGTLRRWKRSRIWFALALIYILMALGPTLAINGQSFPQIPMPYRLVEDWFIFRILRRSDRLNIFLSLPVAMLVTWGWVALNGRLAKRKAGLVTALVAILILIEYAPLPFATEPPTIPAWYQQQAQNPDSFAVFDLPIYDRRFDKWYMLYQTEHRKPLVSGHVSRMPREAFTFLDSTPFLHLLRVDNMMDFAVAADITNQLRVLADADVRYLVIHKKFAHEGLLHIWQDWLTVAPYYEDDEVIVYRTTPQLGEEFELQQPLTAEMGFITTMVAPEEAVQGGTIKVDVRWGSRASPGQDYDACLSLRDAHGEAAASRCQTLVPGWSTSQWGQDEVARGFYVLPVGESLPAASYDLALSLVETVSREPVGQTAVLGEMTVRPFQPEHAIEATWSDRIRLRGYELQKTAGALELILYWQAEQKIETSYKIFVHVTNPETGEIVTQSDAIPRNWNYPTNAWEPSEIVRDVRSLTLGDVPPGQYEITAGLYDSVSGQRLSLSAGGEGETVRLTAIALP